jgi:hypothetical protein
MVPKPRIDECNWHPLLAILVEVSCEGHVSKALDLVKGSILF